MIDNNRAKEIKNVHGRMEEGQRIKAAMTRLKIILVLLFIIIVTVALIVKYV